MNVLHIDDDYTNAITFLCLNKTGEKCWHPYVEIISKHETMADETRSRLISLAENICPGFDFFLNVTKEGNVFLAYELLPFFSLDEIILSIEEVC